MPGFLLDKSATVMCVHGGQAEPAVPNPAATLDEHADTAADKRWTRS